MLIICNKDIFSNSRNTVKHLEKINEIASRVYDKEGHWLSFADRRFRTNKIYKPKIFINDKSKLFYKVKWKELKNKKDCMYKEKD